MKATLEFDVDEDPESFHDALNGWKYMAALQDLDNMLRSAAKHEDDEAAQRWRERLHEICEEQEFGIWD